jgi:hypothetical protein
MKRRIETLLVGAGVASAGRRLRRGRGLILAYHNILPAGVEPEGDRSLHLAHPRGGHGQPSPSTTPTWEP